MKRSRVFVALTGLTALLLASPRAWATKVYVNPSDQIHNEVSGGGVESDYALMNANLMSQKLTAAGFTTRVDQDFDNAPYNANSWGADIFVSVHSNAGSKPNQGHGTSSLYVSDSGRALSDKIVKAMLTRIPYAAFGGDGLFYRSDLHVLNATDMTAALAETVFHDCSTTSGKQGHPPSESAFLRSAEGREAISSGLAEGVCAYFGQNCSSPPPSKGFVRGVVFKAPDLANHIAGATVKLSTGAEVVYDGNSVWSFEVDPGTYTVTASATGYTSATKDGVVVKAGEEAWASVGLLPEQPAEQPDKGTITGIVYKSPNLSDRIAGAVVKLNTGEEAVYDGANDWSFLVAPGTYSITVSADGYQTASKEGIAVTAGEVVSGNIALSSAEETADGTKASSGCGYLGEGAGASFSLLALALAVALMRRRGRSRAPVPGVRSGHLVGVRSQGPQSAPSGRSRIDAPRTP